MEPERAKNNRPARRERWWQFAELARGLRTAIADLDHVTVIAQVSRTLIPMRVPARQVLSMMLVVFALDDRSHLALLSSSAHQAWAVKYGSAMRNDPRYTPSDVFETFPRVGPSRRLTAVGSFLEEERKRIMLRRQLGLTSLYNLVNDSAVRNDSDIDRMREIHVEVDAATMEAYGWQDILLDHGFHTYRQMERWTVSGAARVEILDRLLELNHERARAEGQTVPEQGMSDRQDTLFS